MTSRRSVRATVVDANLGVGDTAVEAFVVGPGDGQARAGILFLHWLGEHRSDRTEFLSEAKALAALEGEGFVLRGRFSPGLGETEWCERRLLARIHRATLDRLRREIEPVAQADFVRFLLSWQRLDPDGRAEGADSLAALVAQLEGFEAAASAWEGEILPARMKEYDPAWLDALALAGRFVWGRALQPEASAGRKNGPVRSTPIALLGRQRLRHWRDGRDGREAAPVPPPGDLDLSAGASVWDSFRRVATEQR